MARFGEPEVHDELSDITEYTESEVITFFVSEDIGLILGEAIRATFNGVGSLESIWDD